METTCQIEFKTKHGGQIAYHHITLTSAGELLSEAIFAGCGKNEKGFHGRIEDVKTSPEHMGNGYASQVVKRGIQYAQALDLYKLTLRCKPANTSLYERLGFVLDSNPDKSEEVCMTLRF